VKASEARKFSQGKETKRILSMIKYVSGFGIKFLSHPGIVDDETKKELEAPERLWRKSNENHFYLLCFSMLDRLWQYATL